MSLNYSANYKDSNFYSIKYTLFYELIKSCFMNTFETISLLAHLACELGNWGPHLIIVPTSVLLNWDLEFKKWLPGFKVITYYG